MAPITRLRTDPNRRVDYAASKTSSARHDTPKNPVLISSSPNGSDGRSSRVSFNKLHGTRDGRIKRRTPFKSKRLRQERKECFICAETKPRRKNFKTLEGIKACTHFQDMCVACADKMIKTQVAENRLSEAVLACPMPQCKLVLDYDAVKHMVTKGVFEFWDRALADHHIRSSELFVACLNVDCGLYFSVDDCRRKGKLSHKVECPYCSTPICLTCDRPWHTKSCNNHLAEMKKSQAEIEAMGAKPCPNCGVNIQKISGCDHMRCFHCGHNFCFQCFVAYSPGMEHEPGCPDRVENIARDPGNWVLDGAFNVHGPGQAGTARLDPANVRRHLEHLFGNFARLNRGNNRAGNANANANRNDNANENAN